VYSGTTYTVTANFTSVPTTGYPGVNDIWSPAVVSKTVTMTGATTVTMQTNLIVRFMLAVQANDSSGNGVGSAKAVVKDATGAQVANGSTDSTGRVAFLVVGYIKTPTGNDTSMNPYSVQVTYPSSFNNAVVTKNVDMSQGPQTLITSASTSGTATALVVAGVAAAFIAGGALIALVRKP
jgi:hypothetical protein